MSRFERANAPSQHPAWPAARIAWALLGALALMAAGAGVYFLLHPGSESEPATLAAPAPKGAFLFRAHAAPRPVPDLAFEDAEGRKRRLADFRGRMVLLNIWATWCVPCREEMPSLDRLQQKLGGPGFEVLALSIDAGGVSVVKRFYDELGIRALAIYVDPAMRAFGTLSVVGIPTTLLVDRQGREILRRIGPVEWDGPEAERMIAGYLDAAAKP